MTDGVRGRGRPKLEDGQRKRANLTFRVRDALRDTLEAVATAHGRSLSEEIEHRLEQSLGDVRQVWGDDVFAIAESMGKALWHIERENGARWIEDDQAFEDFLGTTGEIIRAYRALVLREREEPKVAALSTLTAQERAKLFAALGGLSPPRARDKPDPDRDKAEREANIAAYNAGIEAASSRSLPEKIRNLRQAAVEKAAGKGSK